MTEPTISGLGATAARLGDAQEPGLGAAGTPAVPASARL